MSVSEHCTVWFMGEKKLLGLCLVHDPGVYERLGFMLSTE